MRLPIWLAVLLPLGVPAQAPQPTVQATATEVLLDLVVRDKKGRMVRDLRPEEVQVFEDGVLQKLRHFEFDSEPLTPREPEPAPGPAAAAQPASPAASPASPRTVNELRNISVVSVVIGGLLKQDRRRMPGIVRDFLKDNSRPDTYVGVFWLRDGFRMIQPYTNDAEKISAGVDRVAKMLLPETDAPADSDRSPDSDYWHDWNEVAGFLPPEAPLGPAAGPSVILRQLMAEKMIGIMHDVYDSSMRHLMGLRALVDAQAAIPGRKVVLLFSDRVPVHPDTVQVLRGAISAANRANVTIYAIPLDPMGPASRGQLTTSAQMLAGAANASKELQMKRANGGDQEINAAVLMAPEIAAASVYADERGNLEQLTEGTGGAAIRGDLRGGLRRAMEEARAHYELTYSPANAEIDGRYRRIQVTVSRPGATVFAREGYFALPVVNGAQIYPFEMATLNAINSKPLPRQFDFRAAALEYRHGSRRVQLAFVFQAPAKGLSLREDGKATGVHLAITALVKDQAGQVVEKISKDLHYQVPAEKTVELRRGVVSFTAPFFLPPGRYTIETAAVDRESMKASVRRSLLRVEHASGLSMSDLTLVRRVDSIQAPANPADPLQARGGQVTPELSDSFAPDFAGPLQIYAVAYPPAPGNAPVRMTVEIARDGQPVMRSPEAEVQLEKSGVASVLAVVPREKLAPGQYEARITFHYKDQTVTKEMVFTVEDRK